MTTIRGFSCKGLTVVRYNSGLLVNDFQYLPHEGELGPGRHNLEIWLVALDLDALDVVGPNTVIQPSCSNEVLADSKVELRSRDKSVTFFQDPIQR